MYSETNKNWKQSTFEDMLTLLKSTQVSCTLWIYFKNRWPQSEGFWFNYSFPGDTCLWFVLFSAILLFLFLHWSFFSNFSFDLSILRPHHPCLLVIFVNCPACISATPSAHSSFCQILPFILLLLILPHEPNPRHNKNSLSPTILPTIWTITCPGSTKPGPIPTVKSVLKTIWNLEYVSLQYLWLGSVNQRHSMQPMM